jgi:thiol-disulfide isomerase/thioredoxin
LPLINLSALHAGFYFTFITEALWRDDRDKVDPRTPSENEKVNRQETEFSRISQTLSGEVKDAHLAWRMLMMIESGNIPKAAQEKLVQTFGPDFTHRKYIDFVLEYFHNRARLHPGDPAPGFSLVDTGDQLVSLSDFSGQYVLIGFWFSGCKPCIAEFPYENQLVEKYRNQPIAFVNVCFDSPKEHWLRTVRKHNVRAINLYCESNWNDKIKRDYFISGTPRYVLIDPAGRVVDDNCPRPSGGLDATLASLLGK